MDGNGAAATGDEEQNGAHVAVWEDSFAPFSEGFEAACEKPRWGSQALSSAPRRCCAAKQWHEVLSHPEISNFRM
jgi:hypothetical protein